MELVYSDLNRCGRCGQPTGCLSLICKPCLYQQVDKELFDHLVEAVRGRMGLMVDLARDRGGVYHAVHLPPEYWRRAWCGRELTQPRPKRKRAEVGRFPTADMCEECLRVYARVKERI
jgi:hypothetical protein